jgi:hypothetical protein
MALPRCDTWPHAVKTPIRIWDEHPEHKKYKERGKTDIFESYDVSVGEIFERHIK